MSASMLTVRGDAGIEGEVVSVRPDVVAAQHGDADYAPVLIKPEPASSQELAHIALYSGVGGGLHQSRGLRRHFMRDDAADG